MQKITDSFIRSVQANVEECSSIVQLCEVFKRFQPYIYNDDIFNSFLAKVDFFEARSVDCFISGKCEDLRDDLEIERTITMIGSETKQDSLEINMVFYGKDGELLQSCVDELVRLVLTMAKGKKAEAARILGVHKADFGLICDSSFNNYIKTLKRKAKNK